MQKPIRILTFLEAHSITGPAKIIIELAQEASRRNGGHRPLEIEVATFLRGVPENDFTRAIASAGIPIEVFRENRVFDPAVIPQMRAALERRRPDIIWTHAVKSHFLVRLARLHRGTHWIASHHGYTTTDWKTRAYNELDRWSHLGAERVLTVCDKFARDLQARGVQTDRIRVEHNPVRRGVPVTESERAALRESLGIGSSRVLLSIGRLSLEKGHSELIRALALIDRERFGPLKLVIVGDGPERERLIALSQTLGVADDVVLAGHRPQVRPFYASADLFVLPSYSEGSPNVLLEAMEMRVPAIASNVGGVPEIVQDGVSALLVPPRDPQALADAIVRLLEDAELREHLVERAQETLAKHTPEEYLRNLQAVFEEVAAG